MKMIKSEFAAIKSNRVLMISLMAISFIPFMYCIFFLRSVWDPYGNTGNLPVAVVNEDRAAKFNGKEISAGQQLVDQLKGNKALKWVFVSKQQAAEGMKDKKYYSTIIVPEDFSKNATTLLDKNPKKMNLTYETNDSLNYIGSVISEQGAKAVNDKIKSAITQAYAKAMFAQVEKAGAGFQKAADGSVKLNDGANQLNNGLKTYTGGVGQIGSGVSQLQQGVGPLTSGVNQLAGGAGQLANGLGQLQSKVGPLQAGVGQLANGSGQLVNGLGQLQQNVGPLQAGVGQLNAGAGELAGGINQLNNPKTGLPTAYAGSAMLQQGLTKLQTAITAQQGSSNNPKAPTLTDGITGLKAGVKKLQAGVAGANLTDEQKAAIADLQTQIKTVSGLATGIESAAKGVGISDQQTAALMSALAPQFAAMNEAVQKDMAIVNPVLTALPKQLDNLNGGINQLSDGINSLGAGQNMLLNQVNAGLTGLTGGAAKLNAGLAKATNGLAQLAPGSQKLVAGTNQLNGKIPALASGVNQLAGGANQLNTGLGQLNSNVPALAGGVNQLAGGANQLNSGLGQLNGKVPTLANGVNQLANGANQLTANSGKLLDGASQLSDGSGKLTLALQDGAKQINNVTFTDKTAKMFATPTALHHTRFSYVPNYGHALAPYVLSLALYVGALVFNFIYPIRRRYELGGTTTSWFVSKISIGAIVAMAMGIIEVGLMYLGGIHPDHPFEAFFMACLFALTSIYLVMFLAMTFDNPGRFLAMILLMIQLGGSGGTFPLQVQSGFYNFVSPLLPMTYSILGLREALTGGLGFVQIMQSAGVLILIMLVSLGLLWLGMNHLQKKNLAGNWAEQEIKKEQDGAKA